MAGCATRNEMSEIAASALRVSIKRSQACIMRRLASNHVKNGFHLAACRLQGHLVGSVARQVVGDYAAELAVREEELKQVARLERAATTLQAWVRGYSDRKWCLAAQSAKRQEGVATIKAWGRGREVRRQLQSVLDAEAAAVKACQAHLNVLKEHEWHASAAVLNACIRGRDTRPHFPKLLSSYHNGSASHIQGQFHGQKAREVIRIGLFSHWSHSAQLIQGALVGHQARQVWQYELEEQWNAASVVVQAGFIGMFIRVQMRKLLAQEWNLAARVIQGAVRGHVTRGWVTEQLLDAWNFASAQLQGTLNGYFTRCCVAEMRALEAHHAKYGVVIM